MKGNIHTFKISLDWDLLEWISKADRFDASWTSIEKKQEQSLRQLRSIATIQSVGASTRIEGSTMSDQEVETLLSKIDITKLEDRDSQEVVGYFEALELITKSFDEIEISESSIKNLHNILLRYSKKDEWHRGNYKQHSNAVEATLPDGTKQIIFKTTEPGFATDDSMRSLIDWYKNENAAHPLVKCALFSYEFVTIHPFQDGNGRLSRLLSILLLLKHGYKWVQYISFEHEIEARKTEYYQVLRKCQTQRPGEDITPWAIFFFDVLRNIQNQLLNKLEKSGATSQLAPRERLILTYIGDHAGCKSGEIAKKLNIPNPTIKRILSILVSNNLLEKHGIGPGTNYSLK